jgi:thiol-disulfide isomerase/thioredoxin
MMKQFLSICLLSALIFTGCKKEDLVDTSENEISDVSSLQSFDSDIASGTSLVFFHASWCVNCKAQRPAFESAAMNSDVSAALFLEVEHDDHEDITDKYDVNGFPIMVVFKDGVEKSRLTGKGHSEQQIIDLLKQHL